MASPLQVERDFIKSNHGELSQQYPNKFLVIQGRKVHATCDEFDTAADKGAKILEGDFLVRHVDRPEDPEAFIPTILLDRIPGDPD